MGDKDNHQNVWIAVEEEKMSILSRDMVRSLHLLGDRRNIQRVDSNLLFCLNSQYPWSEIRQQSQTWDNTIKDNTFSKSAVKKLE